MSLNKLAQEIFKINAEKGFHDKEINVGESLMLVVSELGEAVEAHRKDKFANFFLYVNNLNEENKFDKFELSIKDTFEDEMADALIRILHMCARLDIDIEKHVQLKLAYNKTRPYKHGKKY